MIASTATIRTDDSAVKTKSSSSIKEKKKKRKKSVVPNGKVDVADDKKLHINKRCSVEFDHMI